jgi:hypothetical protein
LCEPDDLNVPILGMLSSPFDHLVPAACSLGR